MHCTPPLPHTGKEGVSDWEFLRGLVLCYHRKWREILPVTKTENCVYLGEEATPIMDAPRLAQKLGTTAAGGAIYVKDEGRLPTGSFKARGLVMAVSMAKELGVSDLHPRALRPTRA